MHITSRLKSGLTTVSHFLNQPVIKESIKKISGVVTFSFGLIEIYDVYESLKERAISSEIHGGQPGWVQTATKVNMLFAKISLILSAAVSRPGVFLISKLMGRIATQAQLERVFGPNTTFAMNWRHPRHIASLAAVIFALPTVAQSIYLGGSWAYKKIRFQQAEQGQPTNRLVTDSKVRLMVLWNTFTSRLVLHLGNQLVRQFI